MANEIRVAVIGKTGTGKSSVGNSLLGQKIFSNSAGASSESKQCQMGDSHTPIGKLVVVDTPGLFDTDTPNLKTSEELVKCIGLLSPGPHVFIFVLSVGRYIRDDIATAETLQKLWGKDTMQHSIVLFSRKDQLKGMSVKEFIAHTPLFLKNFLCDVNNRYEFISNDEDNSSHQDDVNKVLELIKRTVQENGNRCYTESMFQAAERVIQNEIQERQKTENKSEEGIRSDIRTDIAKNDPIMVHKVIQAIGSLVTAASPIVVCIIKAIKDSVKK